MLSLDSWSPVNGIVGGIASGGNGLASKLQNETSAFGMSYLNATYATNDSPTDGIVLGCKTRVKDPPPIDTTCHQPVHGIGIDVEPCAEDKPSSVSQRDHHESTSFVSVSGEGVEGDEMPHGEHQRGDVRKQPIALTTMFVFVPEPLTKKRPTE